jgi:hypothetical protein
MDIAQKLALSFFHPLLLTGSPLTHTDPISRRTRLTIIPKLHRDAGSHLPTAPMPQSKRILVSSSRRKDPTRKRLSRRCPRRARSALRRPHYRHQHQPRSRPGLSPHGARTHSPEAGSRLRLTLSAFAANRSRNPQRRTKEAAKGRRSKHPRQTSNP